MCYPLSLITLRKKERDKSYSDSGKSVVLFLLGYFSPFPSSEYIRSIQLEFLINERVKR